MGSFGRFVIVAQSVLYCFNQSGRKLWVVVGRVQDRSGPHREFTGIPSATDVMSLITVLLQANHRKYSIVSVTRRIMRRVQLSASIGKFSGLS